METLFRRGFSRDEMKKRVARFRDLQGSDGGLPDSNMPGCERTLFNVIGFQPPQGGVDCIQQMFARGALVPSGGCRHDRAASERDIAVAELQSAAKPGLEILACPHRGELLERVLAIQKSGKRRDVLLCGRAE